jgi:serine/threonine-protein kinase
VEVQSLSGTTLDGRYEIGRMIGGGGMGHVYEAQHVGTLRRVAIKVISTGELARDKQIVGRFQREAKAAGAIDTQHICQVLDTGTDPESGSPFMVMELMTGEDVQQLLQRTGPVAPELALRIVGQACLGLAKAHEVDVVHRDIKPANLFLARRDGGEVLVKLLDFGIAKVKMEQAQSAENAGLTRTGMMLGSPLYMSPEQARGAKSIDHRTDLWSLGVVLYQTLTGRTPFQHIDALGELIMAICSEPPRPVQELAPWVEPEVAEIVHRALQAKVDQRFQSAMAMHEAIRSLLPNGVSIEESMLVGITEEQRAHVARRVTVPPPPAPTPSMLPPPGASLPPPSVEGRASSPALSSSQGIAGAGTTGGLAQSRAPESRSNTAFVAVGGVLGMVVAGVVAFVALRDAVSPDAPATAATALPTTTAPPPPPDPTDAPVVAPVAQDRTVKLVVIAPDGATVEVDHEPAKLRNGVVEITGPLGSVHRVTLAAGDDEVEEDVVVTEIGAQPPKVTLEKKKPGAPRTAPAPKTSEAPKAPPKPEPGIETKFE